MSYSEDLTQEQQTERLGRLKELADSIRRGEKLKETIETEGWQEVIEPLLDKMIVDVLGQKEQGRWHNGSLSDKRLGESRLQVLCAYKTALTDLHDRIYIGLEEYDKAKAEYEMLIKYYDSNEQAEELGAYE